MSDGPFEPDEGQESEPPSIPLTLLVATHLLLDLQDYLEGKDLRAPLRAVLRRGDPRDDLLLRIPAVLAVLRRAREEVADGHDG